MAQRRRRTGKHSLRDEETEKSTQRRASSYSRQRDGYATSNRRSSQESTYRGRRESGGDRSNGIQLRTVEDAADSARVRRPGYLQNLVRHWYARLMGAVEDRSFQGEEEYQANQTTKDYLFNGIGTGIWGVVFPLLTIVITQLTNAELAGMFSLAFVAASLLMILANFGVHTFQVSDVNEEHSFADYQLNRIITCVAMLLVGYIYCTIRGYDSLMFTTCMGLFFYKMVDGLADVYEGRLQQVGKLYLGGVSMGIRSLVALVFYTVALLVTGDMGLASVVMAAASFATLLFVTVPLTYFETPKSSPLSIPSVVGLFKQSWPLFAALFMYSLVDNMPKFVMEGALSYDNQLYFNALYFPAQYILLTAQLIYKPLLVKMAQVWQDVEKRRRFDIIILAVVVAIVVITLVMSAFMNWAGLWLLGLLYGIDFEQFRQLCFVMLAAGGITAGIDFLYQTITVLRRQRDVMIAYIIAFVLSLFAPMLLINFAGLPGAVIGYLIVMAVLFILMLWLYARIRFAKE